jgi:O-antigen/teichoic acid export membrane protein
LWLFANTAADFGLGLLLTREVARDRSQANRFLSNSVLLRVLVWSLELVPFGLVAGIYVYFQDITLDTAFAFMLLMIGILPSTLSASLAFLFNAYERFEYRVAVDIANFLRNTRQAQFPAG